MKVLINGKSYYTLDEAARLKHVKYPALKMWLRNHKEAPRLVIRRVVFVAMEDLDGYIPYSLR